jgi:hypothetical protein
MAKIAFVFFDAGSGHRSAAVSLCETISRQGYPWDVQMVNLQEVLDPIDFVRRLSGLRIQDLYNLILKRDWTRGARYLKKALTAAIRFYHDEEVRLLEDQWSRMQPDLVVSLVPYFNRALRESFVRVSPRGLFVTILTDIADYPPHFWIEDQEQFFICGSKKAVEQARAMGIAEAMIYCSSGMIINPRFYEPLIINREAERRRLGLHPLLPTGIVMFGGQGSASMLEIADRVEQSSLSMQLIHVCGRNEKLAATLRKRETRAPKFVEGFTTEIPYYMQLADFFIGKPGPGSISEALAMKLPVIVQLNPRTLPQERNNVQWIYEKQVGLALDSFRNIVPTITELLNPQNYFRLRSNAAALNNHAVLEIPSILHQILEKS